LALELARVPKPNNVTMGLSLMVAPATVAVDGLDGGALPARLTGTYMQRTRFVLEVSDTADAIVKMQKTGCSWSWTNKESILRLHASSGHLGNSRLTMMAW
jgi:hypothetical protein